jgi:hypothetical protein
MFVNTTALDSGREGETAQAMCYEWSANFRKVILCGAAVHSASATFISPAHSTLKPIIIIKCTPGKLVFISPFKIDDAAQHNTARLKVLNTTTSSTLFPFSHQRLLN